MTRIITKTIYKLKKLGGNGFFYIIFGGTFSKMIAFISSIVIVRLVDKTAYADLAYADNLYFYITLFAGFGMSSAVLKFGVSANQDMNYAYYLFAFKWGTLFQIFQTCILIIMIANIHIPFAGARKLLFLLIPYGILYYWMTLLQSFLRTQFENKKYAISSFLQVFFTFLFSVIFVCLLGITGIPYARTLAIIFSILIYYKYLWKKISSSHKYQLSLQEIRPFILMALSLLVSNVFSMVMPANEVFLINNIIKSEVITANYKVANLIPSQLPFFTSAIIVYYFPIFAKQEKKADTWKLAKKVGFYTFLLNLFIMIIGMVLTPFIIRLAYGSAYKDINNLSIALWFVCFLNAGFRMIPMNILPALGIIKFNVLVSVISCIIHVLMDYFMITRLGIEGAVVAIGIIYLFSGLVYWEYLYIKCKEGE